MGYLWRVILTHCIAWLRHFCAPYRPQVAYVEFLLNAMNLYCIVSSEYISSEYLRLARTLLSIEAENKTTRRKGVRISQ